MHAPPAVEAVETDQVLRRTTRTRRRELGCAARHIPTRFGSMRTNARGDGLGRARATYSRRIECPPS